MRIILVLWFVPILLFGGWYALSFYDLNFGFFFLERGFHDLIFQIYGNMLGMPGEDVPALIAGAFFVDSLLILGIAAVRWHKAWLPQFKQRLRVIFGNSSTEDATVSYDSAFIGPLPATGSVQPAE